MTSGRGDSAGRVDHNCFDHLVFREAEWTEAHGLDCGPFESCYQAWWECAICGGQWTAKELDREMERQAGSS